MNSIFFVEGVAGASGDMILAALLDLGYPIDALKKLLRMLDLDLKLTKTTKQGLQATIVTPILPNKEKTSWGLKDFLKILDGSKLPANLKNQTAELFRKLAAAEASVHGVTIEKLHFHELGGWDTLFDLVAVSAALDYLKPFQIHIGPLNVGGGTVKTEHGILPVPAPATAHLLQGFTLYSSDAKTELVTPTGALLLSHFGIPSDNFPPMKLERMGLGAGEKNLPFPNILRIFSGTVVSTYLSDSVVKLETNVDDMNPQFWDHAFETCYEAGALEVFLTPLLMKKNRPAYLLTVLVPVEAEAAVLEKIFQETTTLGIRREIVSRVLLKRTLVRVETPYGEIPCKVGYQNGTPLNITPEYDVMKMLSRQQKVPLKTLYQSVMRNFPN